MAPLPHSRPEAVLKRAQELVGVGQTSAALSLLHEHLVSKRTRNQPLASLEPVVLLFVELCVEFRKGKLAKDGLYQFKNTAQNANIASIELVFKKFIELSEAKVTEAQSRADTIQTNVDDLEASETPESILLSTVSGEQSKDRTDRAVVTPWLKFLWETYRTVLDIFKNNSRLETMYQSTAHQAFQFCSKYQRKTEFRRLCELLRNHLQNVAKFTVQMHAINLNDPDTLQRHLDTRFQQLNVAVELELYQEAFRSVEDIHTLLNMSKRPAKPVMMANYFEKLAKIFLVSENYLFHAAAWSRYYNLIRQSSIAVSQGQSKKDHPSSNDLDITKAASYVLLATLSIPVISTSRSRGALFDVDEAGASKNLRLSSLLAMSQPPNRDVLLKDALSRGLLKRCRPEIAQLYRILEVDFHPLSICNKISPILKTISADKDMATYIAPLQQVVLTRLFQQLSQVYDSVTFNFVLELAKFPEPFDLSPAYVEKFMMNGCKKGHLAIRVDHSTGMLTFESDVFSSARSLHNISENTTSVQRLQMDPMQIVRTQLSRLAKTLFTTCQYVDPSFNEEQSRAKEVALERAEAGFEQERRDALSRREIIDRMKQAASTALAQKEKDLATQKRLKAQELQAAETKRLADEQRDRERRRLEAERKRVQEEEAQKAFEELKRGIKNLDVDEIDVSALDSTKIRAIKIRAIEKEKTELSEKLRVTGRRLDHLERAYRIEEAKHVPEDYEKQKEFDKKTWEISRDEQLEDSKAKHVQAVELKKRLGRLVSPFESFRSTIQSARKSEFERRRKQAEQEFEQKKSQRIRELREQRQRERKQREEEERRLAEEEEREAREAEERRQKDEELRERMARAKQEREEERRRLDEIAQKQREREAEAEARRSSRRTGGGGLGDTMGTRTFSGRGPAPEMTRSFSGAGSQPAAETPSSADGSSRPVLNLQRRGGGSAQPSWRDKQANKQATGGGGADASPAPPVERGYTSRPRGGFTSSRGGAGYSLESRELSRGGSGRGDSGRGDSTEAPAQSASADGKYRPGAFKTRRT